MILLVNDLPAAVDAFGRVLDRVGVPYEAVVTYTAARAALERGGWTGFILDIFLPGGTGVDLLERIRTQPRYRHTPAAVTTADLLLENDLVARIQAANASLHIGVFDRASIEDLCLNLLLA